MPTIIPEIEDIPPPVGRRTKQKFALHGRRRHAATKALKQILTLYSQDRAESARAERMNQTPLLTTGVRGNADDKAFQKCIARLKAMLALKL